jgi:hypothetical protein
LKHVFEHAAAGSGDQIFEEKQLDLVEFEVLQAQTHLHQKCERDERPQESLRGSILFRKKKIKFKKRKKKLTKHTSVGILEARNGSSGSPL